MCYLKSLKCEDLCLTLKLEVVARVRDTHENYLLIIAVFQNPMRKKKPNNNPTLKIFSHWILSHKKT